jgi:putative phosphoesterase
LEKLTIAVISDIHSNLAALEACIDDSRMLGAERYIVLGDIISDWHKPNECLNMVRGLTDLVIAGNREQYMKDAPEMLDYWILYDQYASLLWTYRQLTSRNLTYVRKLPDCLSIATNNYTIRAVHGSPFSQSELCYKSGGLTPVGEWLEAINEDILLCGHSHEQWKWEKNGKIAVNPGSCGSHFNKRKCAEYAIIELSDTVSVQMRQVKYNVEQNFRSLMKSDLYEKAYDWVLINYLSMVKGENELGNFLNACEEERRKDEFAGAGPIPNDIYKRVFEEKFSEKIKTYLFDS